MTTDIGPHIKQTDRNATRRFRSVYVDHCAQIRIVHSADNPHIYYVSYRPQTNTMYIQVGPVTLLICISCLFTTPHVCACASLPDADVIQSRHSAVSPPTVTAWRDATTRVHRLLDVFSQRIRMPMRKRLKGRCRHACKHVHTRVSPNARTRLVTKCGCGAQDHFGGFVQTA